MSATAEHQHQQQRAELVARWYREGHYGHRTIADALRSAPDGGRVVFSSDAGESEHDLGELHEDAERLARGLRSLIDPGDVVAIQAPAGPDTISLFAAVWLAGGVVLPIVDIYGRLELPFILRQSGAVVLAVPVEWRGRNVAAEAAALVAEGGTDVATVLAIGEHAPAGTTSLDVLRAAAGPDHGDGDGDGGTVASAADDVALLVYTSGTTSDPKGVQHTHNSVLAALTPPEEDKGPALASFPAGHIAGALGMLRVMLYGGTTVVLDRWSAQRAAALIETYGITGSMGTPFYLATLLDEADRSGRDVSTLREFLTGAATVPPILLERAERRGIVSWRTYGSTEHPVISTGEPTHNQHQRHHTDGAVVEGAEVRILDEEGRDVPFGTPGEVVVRGPKLFVGYRDPTLDAGSFLPGGWFRTGDIGTYDADGWLTITDRLKDIIIRGGENISSREVEQVLLGMDAVADAAVCSAPDPLFGEAVCAFVVLRPGAALDLASVEEWFAAAGVARPKWPTRVELVDAMPRTPSGKVRKADLRARTRQTAPQPGADDVAGGG